MSTGRKIADRFELNCELGVGASSTVYRAWDCVTQRDVVLKLLLTTQELSKNARRRFEREAVTLANLKHPSIATLFDFGFDATSQYLYLVI